jgi:hypothetical protein
MMVNGRPFLTEAELPELRASSLEERVGEALRQLTLIYMAALAPADDVLLTEEEVSAAIVQAALEAIDGLKPLTGAPFAVTAWTPGTSMKVQVERTLRAFLDSGEASAAQRTLVSSLLATVGGAR